MKKTNATPSETSSSRAELAAAFRATRAARRALAEKDLWRMNVNVDHAVGVALRVVKHLEEELPEVEALPGVGEGGLARIRTLALALEEAELRWADARCSGELVDRRCQEARQALAEARVLRSRLVDQARMLTSPRWKVLPAKLYAQLALEGTERELISDLRKLVSFFRTNWEVVGTKTPLTWEEVERAGLLCPQLPRARVEAKTPIRASATPVAEDRRRALTLLLNAYDELRKAVEYLRPGLVARHAPGLVAGPRSRTRCGFSPRPKKVARAKVAAGKVAAAEREAEVVEA